MYNSSFLSSKNCFLVSPYLLNGIICRICLSWNIFSNFCCKVNNIHKKINFQILLDRHLYSFILSSFFQSLVFSCSFILRSLKYFLLFNTLFIRPADTSLPLVSFHSFFIVDSLLNFSQCQHYISVGLCASFFTFTNSYIFS